MSSEGKYQCGVPSVPPPPTVHSAHLVVQLLFILMLINRICLISLQVAMYQHMSLKHQFVLSPVSARAYIKRNRSEQPLRSRTQPRIVCELHLEEVPLSLTDVSSSVCSNRIILNSTRHFCVLLSPLRAVQCVH
jgi:hypothetical protein